MNNNTAIYTKHKVTTFSNGTTYVIHRKTLSSILLQEIYIVYALACHDANEHLIILCRDQNNNLHFIWASIQGDRLSRVKLGTSLSGEVIKAEITDTPFKMKSGRKSSHNGHVLAIGMRDGSVYIGTFGVTDTEVDITMKLEMVTDNDTLGVLSAVSIIPPNAGPRSNSPFVLLGYSLGGLYLYKVRATIYHPTAPRLAGRTDLSEQVNFLNNPISCCSGGRSDTTTDIFISFAQDMYTDRNNNYIKVCKVTEAKAIESVFYSEDMNVDCTLKCHPYGNTLSVLVYQPDRNGFRETHINMATTETMAEYFVSEKECLAAYNTSLTYLLSNAHLVEKMIQDRHRKMKRKAVRINPSLIIPVRKRRKYAKNSSASQKIDTNFDTKSIPVKRKGDNINPSLTIPAQKKRRHARYSSVDQKIDTIFNTKPVVVKKKAEDETHCSFSRLDPIHARKYPVFLDGVSQKDQTFGSCHNSSTNAINTEATRTLPEGEALTCISPDNDLNETGSILSENHFRSSSEHPIEENITTTVYDSTSSTLFSSNTSTSTPTSSVYNDNENIPVADNYSITHSTHSTIIEQNITYQNEAVEKDSHEYSKSTSIDSHTANHSEENNPKLDEEAYAEGANEIHKDDGEYTPLLNAGSNDNNLFVDYTGQTVAFSNVKEKPTDDNTQDVDDTALKDDAAVSSPLLQNEDILSSDSSSSIVNVLDNTQQLEIYAAHLQPIFDNDSTKSVDSEITIEPFNITASDSPIISIQKSENIIVADQLNNSSYDSQQIPDSYTRDGEDINTYNQVIEHQLDTSCFSSSLHDGRSRSSFDYFQERDSISVWSDNSVKSNKDSVLTDHSSNSSQDEEKNSIAGQLDSSYGHSQIDLAIDDSNISTHYNDTVSASDHSIHSSSRIRNESFADHLNRFSDNSLTEIIIAQSDLSSENDDGGSASSHSILSLQNNESSSVSSHSSQHNRDHFITGQPDMLSGNSHTDLHSVQSYGPVEVDDSVSAIGHFITSVQNTDVGTPNSHSILSVQNDVVLYASNPSSPDTYIEIPSDNSLTGINNIQSDLSSVDDDGGSASSHSILSLQNNESISVNSHSSQHSRDYFITGQPDMLSGNSHTDLHSVQSYGPLEVDDNVSAIGHSITSVQNTDVSTPNSQSILSIQNDVFMYASNPSSPDIEDIPISSYLDIPSDNSLTGINNIQSDLSSENDDGGSESNQSILSLQNDNVVSDRNRSSQHGRKNSIIGRPDRISESSHIENMNTLFHNSVASDDGDSASNRSSLFSEDSQNNFITGHTGRILDNISRELVSDQFDISPQNSEDNLTIIPPDCISQDSEEAIPEHHSNSSYNNSLGNIGVYIYNNDSHNSSLYPALHSSNSLSDCSIDTAGNILGSSPDNSQIPFSSALGNVSEGNPEGFSDDTLANPDDNTEMGADEVINQVTDITLDSSLSGSIEYLDEDSEEDPDNFAVSSYFPMSSSSHSEIEGIPDTSSTVYESFSENGSNPASTVYYDSQYESPSGRSSIASNTSSSNSAIDSMELLDYRNVLDTISSENEPPIADNPELHIESIEYRGVDHESNEEAYPCIHSASPEPIPIHEHSERPKLIIEQSSLVGSSESVLPCPSEELSEPSELPASDVSGLDRDGLSIIFTNTMEQRLTSAMNGMQNTVENMEYIMQRLFRLTNTIDAGIGRFVQFLNRHTLETEAHEEVQVDRKVVSEHSNLLIPSSHDTPTMNVHTPLNNDPSYTDSSFNGCITDMYSNNDVPDAHDMHNNDNELASENYNADNSDDGIDSNKGPSEQVDSNDNNRNESNTSNIDQDKQHSTLNQSSNSPIHYRTSLDIELQNTMVRGPHPTAAQLSKSKHWEDYRNMYLK